MKKHSNQRTSKSTGIKIFQQFLTEQHHPDKFFNWTSSVNFEYKHTAHWGTLHTNEGEILYLGLLNSTIVFLQLIAIVHDRLLICLSCRFQCEQPLLMQIWIPDQSQNSKLIGLHVLNSECYMCCHTTPGWIQCCSVCFHLYD